MATTGYDTNLASEFYVISCLHRIGLGANLTLVKAQDGYRGFGILAGNS